MPAIAIAPLAWSALRIGAMAAVAIYASRRASQPKDPRHETVLDDLPNGVTGHSHRAEAERGVHGAGRMRRVLKVPGGPALEVDAAGLGRIRFRRVD